MKITIEGEDYKFELRGKLGDVWPQMFGVIAKNDTIYNSENVSQEKLLFEPMIYDPSDLFINLYYMLNAYYDTLYEQDLSFYEEEIDFKTFMEFANKHKELWSVEKRFINMLKIKKD